MSALDWYRRASVRNKILLGFGLVMLFVLLAVALVVVQTLQIDRLADEFERGEAVLNEVQDVEIALADRAAAFATYLLTGEETARAGLESAEEQLDVELREARALGVQREGLQPIDSVARLADRFRTQVVEPGLQLRRRVTAGELTLDQAFATLPADLGRDIMVQERELLERIVDEQTVLTASERQDLSQANGRIRGFTILMTLLAAAVGVAVALWISSAVSTPLTRAVEFAAAVAGGDLTQRLPIERDDEFGTLSGTLNRMAEDLRRMVGEVNTATVQVASAAEQIAATSKHISETVDAQVGSTEDTSSSMEEIASQIARVAQSTESLASSVDQTSSSVAEMGESIEQTARNADRLGTAVEQTSVTIEEMVASITQVGRNVEETGRIVEGAEADATKGGEAVARSSEGMRRVHTEMSDLAGVVRELGDTGESIGRISEVIEDIADQTNLLALNAAIEAARAGEHGRGFAVVAHEIRRLAERSVEAAREIGATIGGVREEVDRVVRSAGRVLGRTEEGLGLADAAGSALEQITASAGRTRDLMAEVHTATRQQIGAAAQVQEAIRQMQEVAEDARTATREQAEGARQIVRAVEDMNLQTQEVFAATAEQKRGGELVVRATDDISRGAREAQGAVKELVGAAEDLSAQASRLTELVDRFRV